MNKKDKNTHVLLAETQNNVISLENEGIYLNKDVF